MTGFILFHRFRGIGRPPLGPLFKQRPQPLAHCRVNGVGFCPDRQFKAFSAVAVFITQGLLREERLFDKSDRIACGLIEVADDFLKQGLFAG